MTRAELNNKIHRKIVNDELYEDEVMEDIMQLVDAYVKEQLRIGGVSESFSKSDLLDLGGWFDGSPEYVKEVVNEWLNAR